MTVAAAEDGELHQLVAEEAFLETSFDEEIYG